MGWIGVLLFVVGLAKLGDAYFMATDNILRSGMISGSTAVITLGALLMILHWLFKKPEASVRSLADICAQAQKSKGSKEAGFTLMEVIVTLALVALLFSMVAGILVSVLNVSEKVSENGDVEKIGYGVLGLVQRDIQGCVAYGLGPVVFKGEDKSLGGGDADEIFFITTSPGSVFEDPNAEDNSDSSSSNPSISSSPNGSDETANPEAPKKPTKPRYRKVSYVLRESPDADKSNGEERYVLCRRSVRLTKEDRDVTSGSAPYVEVVDGIKSFKIEYKESTDAEWVNSWEDSSKIPATVRFTIEATVPFKQVQAARSAGRQPPNARRFTTVASILAASNISEEEEE
jgi:prepilin-type N-terminal cleavage/methylation domain-containing protein